jgi:hypothetical protein
MQEGVRNGGWRRTAGGRKGFLNQLRAEGAGVGMSGCLRWVSDAELRCSAVPAPETLGELRGCRPESSCCAARVAASAEGGTVPIAAPEQRREAASGPARMTEEAAVEGRSDGW